MSVRSTFATFCKTLSGIFFLSCLAYGAFLLVRPHHAGNREELLAILANSSFHTDNSGQGFDDYVTAVTLLKKEGWTGDELKSLAKGEARMSVVRSSEGLKDAANLVARGAEFTTAVIPLERTSHDTTVKAGHQLVKITELQLPADAALAVARDHLRASDRREAIRFAKAAFAMALHLISSPNPLVAATGMACADRALKFLDQIASEGENGLTSETCRAARIALDEEFKALKARNR